MSKRVLFVTYYFPPIGGVGSIRGAKFARYLPEFGWQPVVFHAGAGNQYMHDESMLAELPAQLERFPVRTLEGATFFRSLNAMRLRFLSYRIQRWMPIDMQIGWLPGLLQSVRNYVELHGKPDVLFTSSAPYSANLAGLILQRELGIPWVADFRDEWTRNPGVVFPTPLHRSLAVKYETETLHQAEALITVTQSLVEQFQELRPGGRRKVELIRNGYDETDFQDPAPDRFADKWTLAVVGSVFWQNDPKDVLEALGSLIQAGEIPADSVRVIHVGNGKINWPSSYTGERTLIGFVSHFEAVQWMRRVHLLILVILRAEAAGARIYEHMRSGTPILAMTPPGEASMLVESTETGKVVGVGDTNHLRNALLTSYRTWQQRKFAPVGNQRVAEFSRKSQSRHLGEILDAVYQAGCNPRTGK